jgi:hypothetical protein
MRRTLLSRTAATSRATLRSVCLVQWPRATPAACDVWRRCGLSLAALHLAAIAAGPVYVCPPPAAAILNSPIAQIPRSVDAALRRSIPAFNSDVRSVQAKLEVGFWALPQQSTSIHPSIDSSIFHPSNFLSACLFVSLSVSLSVNSTQSSVCPSACRLSGCLPADLPVIRAEHCFCPSVCLPASALSV